jgi:ankyrin repeat protein
MEAVDRGMMDLMKKFENYMDGPPIYQHDGWSVFHMAVMNANMEMLEYLLQKYPAGLDHVTDSGETLLHRAAKQGHVPSASFLLDRGADVNARDNSGATPLATARKKNHESMVSFLLKNGAEE